MPFPLLLLQPPVSPDDPLRTDAASGPLGLLPQAELMLPERIVGYHMR